MRARNVKTFDARSNNVLTVDSVTLSLLVNPEPILVAEPDAVIVNIAAFLMIVRITVSSHRASPKP